MEPIKRVITSVSEGPHKVSTLEDATQSDAHTSEQSAWLPMQLVRNQTKAKKYNIRDMSFAVKV